MGVLLGVAREAQDLISMNNFEIDPGGWMWRCATMQESQAMMQLVRLFEIR